MFKKVAEEPGVQWLAGEALFRLGNHYLEYKMEREKCYDTFEAFEKWYSRIRTKPESITGDIVISPETGRYPSLWVLNAQEVKFEVKKRPDHVWTQNMRIPSRMRAPDLTSEEIRACFNQKKYLECRGGISSANRGFLHLVIRDFKSAMTLFEEMAQRDPYITAESPNGYTRMAWVCQNKRFSNEPIELYKTEKHIMAIYLSQFYGATYRQSKAIDIAERFIKGEFGKVTKKQCEFAHAIIGVQSYWTLGRKAAYYAFIKAYDGNIENLKKKDVSWVQDYCANRAAVVAYQSRDIEMGKNSRVIWEALIQTGRKNINCADAWHNLARDLLRRGYHDKGFDMLHRSVEMYGKDEEWRANRAIERYKRFIAEGRFPKKENQQAKN